jgi:hypothetical protein
VNIDLVSIPTNDSHGYSGNQIASEFNKTNQNRCSDRKRHLSALCP